MDDSQFFVAQHYRDFLNREPDATGLAHWTNQTTNCGNPNLLICRLNVSVAFFRSPEFWEIGYLIYRFHKAAYGNLPDTPVPVRFQQFFSDLQRINRGVVVNAGEWQAQLEQNKQEFALEFLQRQQFVTAFPSGMPADQFVDKLFSNTGVTPTAAERNAAVAAYGAGDTAGRAAALRSVAESQALQHSEYNRASVLMAYFGYLRRDPDAAPDSDFSGFGFWLAKLDQFGGDLVNSELIYAFINSEEYRGRFSRQQ